ncbi:MAG: hypothetical protein SOV63_09360 [Pyramidobacter porci]|uniref:hypothetical protein n=1 Tax=Pyramidobacter porci TaxID=2605789 RepID=UPI002A75B55C|nr:hypothetical protein [Pyramidobacter porci]MCI6259976.1 hypothetical protein [Pyramidobacter sp.]MDY2648999.1 hypothetical protein [Pyramidobacter porci]
MRASIVLFVVLFVVIWLMHKPFDVHRSPEAWLVKLHELLELALIMQFVVILNEWLKTVF